MNRTPYPNGKDLITIKWEGDTLALYQEEYYYGGGVALFMVDLDTGENWGDLTINLPGYGGTFLQDFISSDTISKLKGIIKVVGQVRYNMGTYKMVEINPKLIDKIPTWDELTEMLYPEGIEE